MTLFCYADFTSQHTIDRIRAANIKDVESDEALLAEADIIFSIVPPRDALATAKRIADVCKPAAGPRKERKGPGSDSVIYVDLNAISPLTTSKIFGILGTNVSQTPPPPPSITRRITRTLSMGGQAQQPDSPPLPPIKIKFIDGGIIGAPPSKSDDSDEWKLPSIPLSGPRDLLPAHLMSTLNMKIISDKIGSASALKACFASLSKGFTALSILSYTTAQTCGVLPEFQEHLDKYAPGVRDRAEKGITAMAPKAYRWVDEMRQIGETFKGVSGLKMGNEVYGGIAEVYKFVAEDTVLGEEKTNKRKRGTTAEDVAAAMAEGVDKKLKKKEDINDKLELAWRGSWS